MTLCKGRTYIKGVCDKCQHYVTECDPIMKTKFKKAQVVFNNYIFDEVGKLNEFRAKEEALIKQRVSALENDIPKLKDTSEWCYNTLDFYYKTLRLHDRVEEDGKNISELRRDVMSMNRRLVDAEAMIVSLQLKLDTCNLKIDYPVDTLKSCDEKRKIGRPKKV